MMFPGMIPNPSSVLEAISGIVRVSYQLIMDMPAFPVKQPPLKRPAEVWTLEQRGGSNMSVSRIIRHR